ncbi:hypothetical protein D3C87_1161190 [compost metagenome]
MRWYTATIASAAKVSKRQRRIAAAVLMVCWGAAPYFRWPIEPVFIFIVALQLAISSFFIKEQPPVTVRHKSTKAQ